MEAGTENTPQPESEKLRVSDHRAPVLPLIAIGIVASALGIGLGLLIDWFPVAASTQKDQVDTFYDVLIVASVPMFVLVTSVVLYSVYRFRMKPGEENMDGPPIHGNTRLEIVWTALPAIMMLSLCVYAAVELHNAEKAPAAGTPELNVRVVGEQFAWTFYYTGTKTADGKEISSNQLYLPEGRSVKFRVQTKDVLHDFWVPAFRWKIDAVPGITTSYRVTPNRVGSYPVVCAELCGLGHATMRQTAHVMPSQDFEAWLQKKGRPGGETAPAGGGGGGGGAPAASADGDKVFASNGCGGCHTLSAADGATGQIGPNLDTALKDQDAAMIKEDIVDPNAEITKGYGADIMPSNFGEALSPEEVDALVKYLQESQKG
jgi:cytochrome c oxidase subunit 2